MSIDYSAMAFPKASWKQQESAEPKRKRQKKLQCNKVAPVQPKKRKKYKKVPSIMQDKSEKRCFLSMLLDCDYRQYDYLEEHHVLFGCDKWISDAYGLRVYLRPEYHRTGTLAVHNNQDIADLLKRYAQKCFMEEYPDLDWMEIVGRNYLEVENETTEETAAEIQEGSR